MIPNLEPLTTDLIETAKRIQASNPSQPIAWNEAMQFAIQLLDLSVASSQNGLKLDTQPAKLPKTL